MGLDLVCKVVSGSGSEALELVALALVWVSPVTLFAPFFSSSTLTLIASVSAIYLAALLISNSFLINYYFYHHVLLFTWFQPRIFASFLATWLPVPSLSTVPLAGCIIGSVSLDDFENKFWFLVLYRVSSFLKQMPWVLYPALENEQVQLTWLTSTLSFWNKDLCFYRRKFFDSS